jgi:hypothetical protein
MSKKKLSHDGLWGSNPQEFVKQAHSRNAFHLEVFKIIIVKVKWNVQGQCLFLICFLSYMYLVVGRPGV